MTETTRKMRAVMRAVTDFCNRLAPYDEHTLKDWELRCPYGFPFIFSVFAARADKDIRYEYSFCVKKAFVFLSRMTWDDTDLRAIDSCKVPHEEIIDILDKSDDSAAVMKWIDFMISVKPESG